MLDEQWRKSTRSGESNCVEVSAKDAQILVRDSKDVEGGAIRFSASAWEAFIAGAKAGEFDLR